MTFHREIRITYLISGILCMLPTVDLDDQLFITTDKVDDIGPNRFLPNKLEPSKPPSPQGKP